MSDNGNGLSIIGDPSAVVEVRTSRAGAKVLGVWSAENRATAIHEAGHAVVARVLGVPIKSVSIKERWGGETREDRDSDEVMRFTTWQGELDRAAVALAGLAVMEVALGERMSGAHHDMNTATRNLMAVLDSGMDPDPGTPFIGNLGRYEQVVSGWYLDTKARRVEVLLREQYARATELCVAHRDQIIAFATLLYEHRRLSDGMLDAAFGEVGL